MNPGKLPAVFQQLTEVVNTVGQMKQQLQQLERLLREAGISIKL